MGGNGLDIHGDTRHVGVWYEPKTSLSFSPDTDSPQVSSIHSTTLDYEEQELNTDLLNNKVGSGNNSSPALTAMDTTTSYREWIKAHIQWIEVNIAYCVLFFSWCENKDPRCSVPKHRNHQTTQTK